MQLLKKNLLSNATWHGIWMVFKHLDIIQEFTQTNCQLQKIYCDFEWRWIWKKTKRNTATTQLYINWPVEQWKCDVNQLMVYDIHLYSSMPKHHFMYLVSYKFFAHFIISSVWVQFFQSIFLTNQNTCTDITILICERCHVTLYFFFSNWKNIWNAGQAYLNKIYLHISKYMSELLLSMQVSFKTYRNQLIFRSSPRMKQVMMI